MFRRKKSLRPREVAKERTKTVVESDRHEGMWTSRPDGKQVFLRSNCAIVYNGDSVKIIPDRRG